MNAPLLVSSAPYIGNGETTHCLMFDLLIACVPCALASAVVFGPRALLVMLVCVAAAALTEVAAQLLFTVCDCSWAKLRAFRPFLFRLVSTEQITLFDGSALATGLLLAFSLPPAIPLWMAGTGAAAGVLFGKVVFGGIGQNVFNPALVGRAFLLAAWPGAMTTWSAPLAWLHSSPAADAVSSATPLTAMQMTGQLPAILDLMLGNVGGSIGERSAVAILLGGCYLLYKGTVSWHVPVAFIGSAMATALLLGMDPLFNLFAGSLMAGAFFYATDPVTSPVRAGGRLLFGCGAGVLTILIRRYGGCPAGVCYAVLVMNSLCPLIDRWTGGRTQAAREATGVSH